jgi:SH3-like domain-containing protein
MSRRNITEEWKLEGEGEPDDQWALRPAEQNAVSQWQLQDEGAPGGQNDWQPVDYTRTPREPRGNWVLPALVGVALVAVIAYVAWIALERAGLFGPASPPPEPTPVAAVEPPVEEPVPTEEPLDTPPPPPSPTPIVEEVVEPTPEPSPTSIPLVNLESIVINTVGGVNARREPSLQGELIQILPESPTAYLVAADQGEWVQIALADGQLAWVNSQFVQRNSETVLLEEANRRRQAVGLPLLAAPETGEAVPPVEGSPETVAPTETTGLQAPVTITVTVNSPTGLNARETPELGGAIIQLLTVDSAYPAVARTADNQWFQIQLPDRQLAWVAAQFVTATGDVATLPTEPLTEPITLGAAAPITPTQPITPATALTATAPLTDTAPVTATSETTPTVTQVANGVVATVTNLAGSNARATPDREVDPIQLVQFNTALPVVGRSADNEWVQVTLAEGQLGWVLANTVSLNTDIAILPIVSP